MLNPEIIVELIEMPEAEYLQTISEQIEYIYMNIDAECYDAAALTRRSTLRDIAILMLHVQTQHKLRHDPNVYQKLERLYEMYCLTYHLQDRIFTRN